jgi:hypothetical protein
LGTVVLPLVWVFCVGCDGCVCDGPADELGGTPFGCDCAAVAMIVMTSQGRLEM